jgi:transcriptional regulator with XRE-family HTH domain
MKNLNKIKKIRTDRNYTICEFAGVLGVSKSLVEKLESGHKKTSRSFLEKLKKEFPEIDINIFFCE